MDSKHHKDSLSNLFYRGNYSLAGEHYKSNGNDSVDLWILIGSMVFLGQILEAQTIFDRIKNQKKLTLENQMRCRFFLAIGYVRSSEYSKASSLFAQNVHLSRKSKSSLIHFFAFQGAAFFRFFRGNYKLVRRSATKAYAAAVKINFSYGQVLSLDLLGHSLCHLGFINRGLFELQRALSLAKEIGNGSILTALEISIIKYRAQFGVDIENALKELTSALKYLNPEDTYSRAELYLELIRQNLLRGRGTQAQIYLEQAAPLIYQQPNKRQWAQYNLQQAHSLFLKGDLHVALALVDALRRNLNSDVDIAILQRANGLEEKISTILYPNAKYFTLSRRFENFLDQRIRNRKTATKIETNLGEDRIGDIIDAISKNPLSLFPTVKALRLFGLIPLCLNIINTRKAIFLGPGPREIILIDGNNVMVIDKGITQPMAKLIRFIAAGSKSKEKIIQHVWSYEYSPSHHDALLHATIGKIRRALGDLSHWIEWSNEGYRVTPHVNTLTAVNESEAKSEPLEFLPVTKSAKLSLNLRQLKVLKLLEKRESISVREYSRQYRICNMTACRDLADLLERNFVLRIGRGRATVYTLKGIFDD